jgi:Ca-activated chloride channel family protein
MLWDNLRKLWVIIEQMKYSASYKCIFVFCMMCAFFSFFSSPLIAQQIPQKEPVITRILFVFDASQSMLGKWQSGAKIDVAKKLMTQIVDSLSHIKNLEVALRVYGHQKHYPPRDCDDSRLEVPFTKNNFDKIKAKIRSLVPKGTTPIAHSITLSAKDFPDTKARNVIILITDGIEECGGDPCAASLELQKKGVVLKPFVIGMGIDEKFMKTFDCIGDYYEASNESSFRKILNVVISQALNPTTAQVNLLDAYGRATETNVNMSFYNRVSESLKYNFVHTFNDKGVPDTLKIDPLINYKITVHTIPPVVKDSVKLTAGKHTIIAISTPQGDLFPKSDLATEYRKLLCIVRKAGDPNTLNVQEFNNKQKYLVGKYDLEILCLPRIKLKDVDISQSHTTTIQIPQPGVMAFLSNSNGYGSVYLEDEKGLTLVDNLNESLTQQSLVLQPGNYRVVFRPKSSKLSLYTIDKPFRIVSGVSSSISLY